MQSRYDPELAARAVRALMAETGEAVAWRTVTARLIGQEPALVLHGGGNTSVKATATTILGEIVDVLHVKGSGWDLATIEPAGHPAVRLAPLRALLRLEAMTDEAMVNELRTNLLDSQAPNPSVETLLHAALPARYVDHTHADAILALCNQPDGRPICERVLGPGLVWIPYVMPGFALAKRCAEAFAAASRRADPTLMVLEKHGLFTWGDTARESYERTIDAVTRAERFAIEHRRPARLAVAPGSESSASVPGSTRHASLTSSARATSVLPRIRGIFAKLAGDAPERGPIVRTRRSDVLLDLMARSDARALVAKGCMTPDHVLRTKPTALFVPEPAWSDAEALAAQIEAAVAGYAREYDGYFEEMCRAKGVTRKKLDPWPRVVLLPGFGACAVASSARDADIALDIYEHTASVMQTAADVGDYAPCSRADLFDVEYWSLEQAKLKAAATLPLGRCVAAITGGASGIGLATAERMLAAGAHVSIMDLDGDALTSVARSLAARPGVGDRVLTCVADVCDAAAVEAAFARTIDAWGGVDLVVSNAGTADEGRLETEQGLQALRRSIDVNCLGHAFVARAAVEVMLTQRRGGCLAFNASKAAFNPGPSFGPYAVAKAALIGLMRQYAVDLGSAGIRSNAVNADRVRTRLFDERVLESRAAARGLTPDAYFRANLLAREVTANDVADAFVHLGTARCTTGCVLTVDGGNAAAFPR